MNDGDLYYLIYIGAVSTEALLESGFKQGLTDFSRNKTLLNMS